MIGDLGEGSPQGQPSQGMDDESDLRSALMQHLVKIGCKDDCLPTAGLVIERRFRAISDDGNARKSDLFLSGSNRMANASIAGV